MQTRFSQIQMVKQRQTILSFSVYGKYQQLRARSGDIIPYSRHSRRYVPIFEGHLMPSPSYGGACSSSGCRQTRRRRLRWNTIGLGRLRLDLRFGRFRPGLRKRRFRLDSRALRFRPIRRRRWFVVCAGGVDEGDGDHRTKPGKQAHVDKSGPFDNGQGFGL